MNIITRLPGDLVSFELQSDPSKDSTVQIVIGGNYTPHELGYIAIAANHITKGYSLLHWRERFSPDPQKRKRERF
jgi:hypothetical protein